jgi:hypothetical protein
MDNNKLEQVPDFSKKPGDYPNFAKDFNNKSPRDEGIPVYKFVTDDPNPNSGAGGAAAAIPKPEISDAGEELVLVQTVQGGGWRPRKLTH